MSVEKEWFGKKLCKLRNNNGLKQSELAEKIGISSATISYYERGERIPDIYTATKIADCFNISLDEFFERNEYTTKSEYTLKDFARILCELDKYCPIDKVYQVDNLFESIYGSTSSEAVSNAFNKGILPESEDYDVNMGVIFEFNQKISPYIEEFVGNLMKAKQAKRLIASTEDNKVYSTEVYSTMVQKAIDLLPNDTLQKLVTVEDDDLPF